jgi:beta-mannanase
VKTTHRHSPLARLAALAALSLTLGLGAASAPAASASIQLGVYNREAPGSGQKLDEYTSLVGQAPSIVMWYRGLDQPLMYSSEMSNLAARGATPMVSLEPVDIDGNDIPLSQIAAGNYDSYLRKAAAVAKGWGSRLIVRFAYEMNLSPEAGIPWGGGRGAFAGNSAADYVAAWRHVVSIFRAEGASNTEFVWAPNIDDGGIPFTQYFPGEEWVDDVGLDGYNWGSAFASTGHSWLSLGDTFASSYATLTQLSAKPVMITETASAETGGEKAAWIRKGFLNEIPQRFPRVSAAIWFNVQKESDWRVNSSQASLEAFREVAASSLYGGPVPYKPVVEEPTPVIEEIQVTKRIHGKPSKRPTRRTAQVARRGTISYRLSQPAKVEIRIEQRGQASHHVTLRRHGHAGRNTVHFSTKVAGRRLTPGGYRVSVRALANGKSSRERRAAFRVLKH